MVPQQSKFSDTHSHNFSNADCNSGKEMNENFGSDAEENIESPETSPTYENNNYKSVNESNTKKCSNLRMVEIGHNDPKKGPEINLVKDSDTDSDSVQEFKIIPNLKLRPQRSSSAHIRKSNEIQDTSLHKNEFSRAALRMPSLRPTTADVEVNGSTAAGNNPRPGGRPAGLGLAMPLTIGGIQRPGSSAKPRGNPRLEAMRNKMLGAQNNNTEATRLASIHTKSMQLQTDIAAQEAKSFETYYTKDGKLGEGMHASVFKCFKLEDTKKERPFAVKISRDDDIEKKNAFEKEFKITHGLIHKNIVRSIEMFTNEFTGETHQVMEYVDGVEVFEKIADQAGSYSEDDAKAFFKQLLEAIAYMHSQGVAHRDIKPQNILVTNDCKVYVVDFNVSQTKKEGA